MRCFSIEGTVWSVEVGEGSPFAEPGFEIGVAFV